jgi:hypothetical protein
MPVAFLAHAHALPRGLAVDLALGGEQSVHALDILDRDCCG